MQTTLNETNVRALLFSVNAPNLEPKLISDHVFHCRLAGNWRPLGGEREHNHRPATPKGKPFGAKVADQDEIRQGIDR